MKGNRIVLWRHGQTDWNIQNRFQGSSDIPLNEVGHYQIEHATKILAPMRPTQIISSDLVRASVTAQSLASATGLTVTLDVRLRETHGGKWEGKTGAENRANDLANFVRWIDGDDNPAGDVGERRSEVAARATAAIFDALEGKQEQLLVVATHGGTARCVIGSLLKLPMNSWGAIGGLSNACWTILQEGSRGWFLVEHNAGSIPEPLFGTESGGDTPEHVR